MRVPARRFPITRSRSWRSPLLYLLDPNDVIPDCLPDIGTSDDALVLELAFEMGAAGIERYCTWKDIAMKGLFARRSSREPDATPSVRAVERPSWVVQASSLYDRHPAGNDLPTQTGS